VCVCLSAHVLVRLGMCAYVLMRLCARRRPRVHVLMRKSVSVFASCVLVRLCDCACDCVRMCACVRACVLWGCMRVLMRLCMCVCGGGACVLVCTCL
jgi:hypothetical protein